MQSWFIWNGEDCRSKGVGLLNAPPVIWPEERVEHIPIPGQSGDLTELEGDDVYNSYIQTVTIRLRGGHRAGEIKKWLRGSGYVTFSSCPQLMQKARIIGAITLNRLSRNLDIWTGEVQFYCQPLKQRLNDITTSVTRDGDVYNTGDVTERPIFILTATASTMVVTAGGHTLTITGLSSDDGVQIDSEAMMVTTSDMMTNLTGQSSGAFPQLLTGQNTITGSGWSSGQILRRERFF